MPDNNNTDIPLENTENGSRMPQGASLEGGQGVDAKDNPTNTSNLPIQVPNIAQIPGAVPEQVQPLPPNTPIISIIKRGRHITVYSAEQNKSFLLSSEKVSFLAALEKNGYDLEKTDTPDYLVDKWQSEPFWSLVLERMLNYAKSQELNQGLVDAFCLDVLMGRKEANDAQLKALALAFRKFYGSKAAVVALPQNAGPIQFNFGANGTGG